MCGCAAELPPTLPPDARRYIYRLVGAHDVEMHGRDPTGKSILEAYYGESAEDTTFVSIASCKCASRSSIAAPISH